LLQKKYEITLIREVLDQLKEKGFLDDYQFGKQYTEEKIRLKSWGRNKLKAELIKKGISPAVIDKILKEEDLSPTDNAAALAGKKLKILSKRNYDKHELSSKLYAYLYSKGYDYDTIKEVLTRLVNEDDFI
jgi:regulatory protein